MQVRKFDVNAGACPRSYYHNVLIFIAMVKSTIFIL